MGWLARIRGTLAGARATETYDEEARFHVELLIEDAMASGMSADEARQHAHRRFGSPVSVRERTRDEDTLPWLRDLAHDLRHAWRQTRRHPGFALSTVLILTIGIGANTALFTVVDTLLLKPLAVGEPHDLVLFNWLEGRQSMRTGMDGVRTTDEPTGRSTSTSFSYPTFVRLRAAHPDLIDLFAFYPVHQLNVMADGPAEVASGQYVSGNYFRALGIEARFGRVLGDGDDLPGAPLAAVISHRFWQRRFNGDVAVVGRSVSINRIPFTIVGVSPEGFDGTLDVGQSPDLTVPFAAEPRLEGERSSLERSAFLWVRMMGRLAPGVSRERARAALEGPMRLAMWEEWQQALTARPGDEAATVSRSADDAPTLRAEAGGQGLMDTRRRYAQPLFLLAAGGALVLLATCLNLATLLLARGMTRQREIATRLALGVSRGRLVRQLFAESLLLASIGSVAGLALATWGTNFLLIWSPWGDPVQIESALDWRVLAFSGVMALGTTMLFGLVPAWRSTRMDLVSIARQRGGTQPPLTRVLIIVQVAVSLVLLVSAALFVSTLRNVRAVETGFRADGLLLLRLQPQLNGYDDADSAMLYARLIERLEAVPGVVRATVSRHPLLSFSRRADDLTLADVETPAGAGAEVNVVARGYFSTFEIPLVLGRTFDERDSSGAPPVAIVNRAFAARYFAGGNPVGQRFWFGSTREGTPLEIVGMVRDARYSDLRSPTQPVAYVPLAQDIPGQASVAIRTNGDPMALLPAVRHAVAEIDPALPIFDARSQDDQAQKAMARERLFARLSSMLGGIALLLVAIGLYGVLSYAVRRRTSEIGVRMALGARRTSVVGMVLRDALSTTAAGIALGLPMTWLATRTASDVLDELLYRVDPNNPWVLAFSAALLAGVAVVAALEPSIEASRVDPIVTLHAD